MRFIEDKDLSFCLTISRHIPRSDLLRILGRAEPLPEPQAFDDFDRGAYQKGKTGLLNVFEVGDTLITVENSGFLGVAFRTVRRLAQQDKSTRYVSFRYSHGDGDCHYVEIENGTVVANFSPVLDEIPDMFSTLFTEGGNPRQEMVLSAERCMSVKVNSDWLSKKTDTYLINYRAEDD